jgi:hypothetical protein
MPPMLRDAAEERRSSGTATMLAMKIGGLVASALIVGAIPALSYGTESDGPSEANECRPASCKTAYGQLEKVEKENAVKVVAIHPPGRALHYEEKAAPDGKTFVVLSFSGKCQNSRDCKDDSQWFARRRKGMVAQWKDVDPALAYRVWEIRLAESVLEWRGGHRKPYLPNGGRHASGDLILLSATKRQIAFEVEKDVTDLVWKCAEKTIVLAPFLSDDAHP